VRKIHVFGASSTAHFCLLLQVPGALRHQRSQQNRQPPSQEVIQVGHGRVSHKITRCYSVMPLHLSTTLARTPCALQRQLIKLIDVYAERSRTCLFTLSANFPSPQDLADTVNILKKFNKKRGHTLGCLSDSFSAVDFSKSNHILGHENYSNPILSCSLGIFKSSRVVPFRSIIPGKTQPQVGRWHAFRKKDSTEDEDEYDLNARVGTDNGTVSWEDIWNRSGSKNIPLPEELRSLE
jgi:hypothetical protein